MSDEPEADCPKCGAEARRQFFPAGIVFKGSGFYKTDSRAASTSASSTDGAASGSASSAGKDGSGGSSKPAEKPSPSAPSKSAE